MSKNKINTTRFPFDGRSKTITILYGLPGAGKSTYAQSKEKDSHIIDLDVIMKRSKSESSMLKSLGNAIIECLHSRKHSIIVDGLFTTNLQVRKTIDYLKKMTGDWIINYRLVWWEEDRESCLINDSSRRSTDSNLSIKNLPFENPDLNILTDLNRNSITKMKTIRKSPAEVWASNLKLNKDQIKNMKLISQTWSMGGSVGNCWGDPMIEISPDSPLEFTEFDNILEIICPDITYLKYKKIKQSCCSIETEYNNDYYGGGTTSAFHVCDLHLLYESLCDLNLIQ